MRLASLVVVLALFGCDRRSSSGGAAGASVSASGSASTAGSPSSGISAGPSATNVVPKKTCNEQIDDFRRWHAAVVSQGKSVPRLSNDRPITVEHEPNLHEELRWLRIEGSLMTLDGHPIGSTRPIREASTLQLLHELATALEKPRDDGVSGLSVFADEDVPWIVIASIAATAADLKKEAITLLFQSNSGAAPPNVNAFSNRVDPSRIGGNPSPILERFSADVKQCCPRTKLPIPSEKLEPSNFNQKRAQYYADCFGLCDCKPNLEVAKALLWDGPPMTYVYAAKLRLAFPTQAAPSIELAADVPWKHAHRKVIEAARDGRAYRLMLPDT